MARLRPTYAPEFKTAAVQLATERSYSIAEAARFFGLRDNLLCNWKQALDAQGPQAFPGAAKLLAIEEELRRLHAELAARGQDCCVNTVAKRMRDNETAAATARKFRCTTDSNHGLPAAENLLNRQFDPASPNDSQGRRAVETPSSRLSRSLALASPGASGYSSHGSR